VSAVLALAVPYEPQAGDTLLVIAQADGGTYAIGVIRGTGPTVLTAPANLCIQAPHGSIELRAARGIRLRAPLVKVVTKRMEMAARALFERCGEATRWVKETLQVRAGRLNTRVRGECRTSAARIDERAKEDVKINGRRINLG